MLKQTNFARAIFLLLLFLSIVTIGTLCKLMASVIVPIVVALLLTFLIEPFIKFLNKKLHLPWVLAEIIVILVMLILLYSVISIFTQSIKTIINLFPTYEERFSKIYEYLAEKLSMPFNKNLSLFDNLWASLGIRNTIKNIAIATSSNVIQFSKSTLLVFLFIFFLLSEAKSIGIKLSSALEETNNARVKHIIRNIIQQVSHYITIKAIISLLTGIIVSLGAIAIKLPFAVVWGLVAFVLNFIPNFGSIISCAVTIIFTAVQFYPSWTEVIIMTFVMFGVNTVMGYIIEPKWEGKGLGLSPFIILASLSIWGWLWGFAGLVLAVPMTVILKIIFENIPYLRPFAILMGNSSLKDDSTKLNSTDKI